MLVSLLVVFREALEAGLIIGIVLAATEGVAGRARWIAGGIAAGTAGAALVAAFAAALSDAFEGSGQEIFTAAILCFAVCMLSWHILWMSRHARVMATELQEIGQAVRLGHRTLGALAIVIAIAVLREGAEVVLFLYGIVVGSGTTAISLSIGGVAGLVLAGGVSWLLYRGLVAIPLQRLFSVTNIMIALLAAGMAGQAASVLHGADILPGWGETIWDTSFLLSDDSLLGRGLHALIGYSARPSGIQLVAYLATLSVLLLASKAIGRRGRRALATAVAVFALASGFPAAKADEPLKMVCHNQRVEPARLEVPAHLKFTLVVRNDDSTADEFESAELNREKLVAPGQTTTVLLGPLNPANYIIPR